MADAWVGFMNKTPTDKVSQLRRGRSHKHQTHCALNAKCRPGGMDSYNSITYNISWNFTNKAALLVAQNSLQHFTGKI